MQSTFYETDHDLFRRTAREFVEREVAPNLERWERERLIGPEVWLAAGKQGLIGLGVPEEFGGAGQNDWRFRCVVMDELLRGDL